MDKDLEKELLESRQEVERLKAIQERKKKSDMIIGVGVLLVIVGLLLAFTTSVFDFVMPGRSENQRILAVISAIPFSLGVHALYTGIVTHHIGLSTSKKRHPWQYNVFTALWFCLGAFMIFLGFR